MKRADKPSTAMPKPKNGISHKPGEVKSRGHAKDKGGFKSKGFKSEGFTGRAPAKKPRAGQSPPRVREKEREGGPPSKRTSSPGTAKNRNMQKKGKPPSRWTKKPKGKRSTPKKPMKIRRNH